MSTVMNELLLQPTPLGEVFVAARDIPGPTSYTTGGVTQSATAFALLSGIKVLLSSNVSQDGLYFARFLMPRGSGFPTFTMQWFVSSTGLQVANGTNLSASSIRVLAFGN